MGQVGGGFNDALALMKHSKVCSAGIQVSSNSRRHRYLWERAARGSAGSVDINVAGADVITGKPAPARDAVTKKGDVLAGVAFFTAAEPYSDSLYAIT
jgi:hypothetical protein